MAIHYVELNTTVVDGSAFTADDIIVIRSGARAGLLLQNFNGNGRYITITNEKTTPSTKVIINGRSGLGCLSISNCKYIDLRGNNDANFEYGIKVINDGTPIVSGSVWVSGESDHIKLSHLEITCEGNTRHSGVGIQVQDGNLTSAWTFNNFEIHHNYIHDTRYSGMYLGYNEPKYKNNPYVARFSIHDNIMENMGSYGITYKGINGPNNYIYNNVVKRTGRVPADLQDSAFQGIGVQTTYNNHFVEVYDNWIEKTVGPGLKIGGKNHLIYNNIILGCGMGNNPAWGHGIVMHTDTIDDELYDNIIIQASGYGIAHAYGPTNASLKRNLIGDCGLGKFELGVGFIEGTGIDANIYHADVKYFGFKKWTDDGDYSNDDFTIGDPCEGVVCDNICVGKDLWSQKCNPETGLCVADKLIEGNSLSCGYDPCEGKLCPNVCVGTNLWSQKCNPLTGECVTDTLIEANSSQCDYDPCEGKLCPNVCVGTNLWSQKCNPLTGECVIDTLIEANSLQCDYKPGNDNMEQIPQSNMNIVYVDSEHITSPNIQLPAINMIDGDPATYWRTESWTGEPPHPHEVQIDLGQIYSVSRFKYLPRQDVSESGMIKDYEFYVSNDIVDWGQPVSIGTFPFDKNEQEVLFSEKQGRYIRLVALSEFRLDGNVTSVAELNVLGSVYTDLCEGKVCPDVCVGTNLWSQKCNPLTGECVTDTLIEANSLQCDYKPGIGNLEEIPQSEFNIVYVDSEHITSPNIQLPAINMIDGDPATYWRTESWNIEPPHPHEVQIDLGQIYGVSGFRYLPRQDVSESGMIKDYEFYVSNDIVDWGQPVSIGTFPLNRNEQEVLFSEKQGRYIRLVALSEFRPDGKVTSVAELNVLVYVYTDLCEGKVCPKMCIGTDLWSLKCDPLTGKCIPDKLIQVDSPSCIIPDEIPTDDSTNMTYIILSGIGLSGLALLLFSRKK